MQVKHDGDQVVTVEDRSTLSFAGGGDGSRRGVVYDGGRGGIQHLSSPDRWHLH